MIAISNAFFYQLEVVQKDRWSLGPLEIAFVGGSTPPPSVAERIKLDLALNEWNRTCAGGDIRPRDTFEVVAAHVPGIEHRQNPNIIFAPLTEAGNSELHVMLASLLPDAELHAAGLERSRANISLLLAGRYQLPRSYAPRVEQAFARYIWSKIAPARRYDPAFFSRQSPLRLLAGDARFWMQRIYRIALDRRETCFTPTTHENGGWKPLEELRAAVYESIPEEDRARYDVRRPLMGGTIWDQNDPEEREAVIADAMSGAGVLESLDPVIELVHSQRAHEDFSTRASWIKEDFERSFYSKRAKLKVELIETVDDAPVWSTDDCEGYGEVLVRDLIAAMDVRERKLLLALRMGKTVTEVAAEEGHSGHAAISRRVKSLKAKVARLLQ